MEPAIPHLRASGLSKVGSMLRFARRSLAAVRYFSATPTGEVSRAQPSYPTVRKNAGAGRDTLGRRLLSLIYTKRSAVITIRKWKEEGHVVRKYELNRIVRELRKLKRYKHALEHTSPDIVTYNLWLTACNSQGDIINAEKVFLELKKIKLIPDWVTFSLLTSIYIKSSRFEDALLSIKEMEKRVCKKTRAAYSSLISLYTGLGRKEDINCVWKKMKSSFRKLNDAEYNCMISSLIKLDALKEAEEVYTEWESVSVTGDSRVPNLILAAYVNKKKLKMAEMFFEKRMVGKGIVPSYTSWEMLTYGYLHTKQMNKVVECFKKAICSVKKWNPDMKIVQEVYKLLEEYGNVEVAEELLTTLRDSGYVSTELYNLVLKVYVKASKMPLIVGERMKKDKVLLDDETRQLIKGKGLWFLTGQCQDRCNSGGLRVNETEEEAIETLITAFAAPDAACFHRT
ncbi:hypothetical protein E3N88_22072 [Mikania micrantha]|uniref:Pentacotripeptide-repeat region of PRORP domain-containing protein n=1 Tax=Mikania micrantha TaxID=192012 RepID=A0A5N6N9F8_9ASTR|nr:hypothetical protein E3N88_22072 [Mikania micrantha]